MIGHFLPESAMLTGRPWGQGCNALAAVTQHVDHPAFPTPLLPPIPTFAKMRSDVLEVPRSCGCGQSVVLERGGKLLA